VALYTALTGSRFATTSADTFAHSLGFPRAPGGRSAGLQHGLWPTVPDISLNAIANLGYAMGRFGHPVYPGDTLTADSTVIGLKENSDGKTGIVYVRSCGVNQRGQIALDYCRWVMVASATRRRRLRKPSCPNCPTAVAAGDLIGFRSGSGSNSTTPPVRQHRSVGRLSGRRTHRPRGRHDHRRKRTHDGHPPVPEHRARTLQPAGRKTGRFGRRIIYGGHIISLARSLSFNGLANAFSIAAINGGRHVAPAFAGDTIYAWSEVIEQLIVPGRNDLGALRLRTVATKDQPCADFPYKTADGRYDPSVLLDFDYTVLIPRRE
jgi:2-methylfumaryl-CoA hydratase